MSSRRLLTSCVLVGVVTLIAAAAFILVDDRRQVERTLRLLAASEPRDMDDGVRERRAKLLASPQARHDSVARDIVITSSSLELIERSQGAWAEALRSSEPGLRWRAYERRLAAALDHSVVAARAERAEASRALEVLATSPGDVDALRADPELARLDALADAAWARYERADVDPPFALRPELRESMALATFRAQRLELDELPAG